MIASDFSIDKLRIRVAKSRDAAGAQAATDIAAQIRRCFEVQPQVRVIFAAAPSQSEMLSALCDARDIDWSRVTAFHMDEYLGLAPDAPQRFSRWLRDAIFDRLNFGAVHLLEPGDDPAQAAEDYAAKITAAPIDIVCCGIGSNGHLAFNDPPADFHDAQTVKIVDLDAECRQQQVDDLCFEKLSDVPLQAITVTVPALLSAHAIFCTVPGLRKQKIVRRVLSGPVEPSCPASALRLHPQCTLYLDLESAGELSSAFPQETRRHKSSHHVDL